MSVQVVRHAHLVFLQVGYHTGNGMIHLAPIYEIRLDDGSVQGKVGGDLHFTAWNKYGIRTYTHGANLPKAIRSVFPKGTAVVLPDPILPARQPQVTP